MSKEALVLLAVFSPWVLAAVVAMLRGYSIRLRIEKDRNTHKRPRD